MVAVPVNPAYTRPEVEYLVADSGAALHLDSASARALLAANRECLDDLAANALERETLTREDLDEIFAAHELRDDEGAGLPLERAVATLPAPE